ncbi:Hypothetical predicted protein, partial [Marmota monax]
SAIRSKPLILALLQPSLGAPRLSAARGRGRVRRGGAGPEAGPGRERAEVPRRPWGGRAHRESLVSALLRRRHRGAGPEFLAFSGLGL